MSRLLLYGANGFSGAALAGALADLGDRLILAGRNPAGVQAAARRLGLEWRAFGLDDVQAISANLAGVSLVLNCAGPFLRTAAPLMSACVAAGVDYQDICGEWPVFVDAMQRNQEAAARDVMIMPGCAFGIAVTGALLRRTIDACPGAVRLRLGMSSPHLGSRGSAATLALLADTHVILRRGGALVRVPAGRATHDFDFGAGLSRSLAISWPDVVTSEVETGVANIEVYSESPTFTRLATSVAAAIPPASLPMARAVLAAGASLWPTAPPVAPDGFVLVAEAEDRWRRTSRLRLATGDGYSVTTAVGSAIARAVLAGERQPGFVTPTMLFGADWLLGQSGIASAARQEGEEDHALYRVQR